jgi:FkbM family methyltransferase
MLARMSANKLEQVGKSSGRYLVDKLVRALSVILGWRFPRYFGWRDKWVVMTVGIEADLQQFVAQHVKQGETVLDIGSNIGFLSLLFCRQVGPQGHVLAFEPEAENCLALRYNLKRYKQASIYECAISDKHGTAVFYLNSVSGTGNSLMPHNLGTSHITVPCQTLDNFLTQHPEVKPDWVKIDVEGGEFQVLRGMRDTVNRLPAIQIIIELCPLNLGGVESAGRLVAELAGMGLELLLINPDGSVIPFIGVEPHRHAFTEHGYVNLYCRKGSLL